MKLIIFTLATLFSLNTFATTDMDTEIYIVKADIHEGSNYTLQKVPASFCVGTVIHALGPAMTKPVTIKSNYGCGSDMVYDYQINAMSCALISAYNEEYPDRDGNWSIQSKADVRVTLSACGEISKDENFVRAVTEAVYKTFNSNGVQIKNFIQD